MMQQLGNDQIAVLGFEALDDGAEDVLGEGSVVRSFPEVLLVEKDH